MTHSPTPDPTPGELASHRFGQSRVRLMRVTRGESRHDLEDWTLEIMLTGDCAPVFTHLDTSRVLATGTIKDTAYLLARQSKAESIETFAGELIDLLLSQNPQVPGAEVVIQSHLWKRLTVGGKPDPTAFMKGSDERQTAHVSRTRDGAFTIRSGFTGMTVLKTAQSGVAGFPNDELTTRPESTHRLFGTSVTAQWSYTAAAIGAGVAFHKIREHLRERMISTFARHESLSLQQTLYAMARAALEGTDILEEVFLRTTDRDFLPADLDRFGSNHQSHIFIPTDEPYGAVEVTLRRE